MNPSASQKILAKDTESASEKCSPTIDGSLDALNILVFGASRGLGEAFAKALPGPRDKVWAVSRTEPSYVDDRHIWIQADLADPIPSAQTVKQTVGREPVDILIYNAGIWEKESFDKVNPQDLLDIVNVNLSSMIVSVQALVPNLSLSKKGRIFLISSTCGLENEGSSTVGYVAAKFGVRGAAHALREFFRESEVTVTAISPGSMATDIPIEQGTKEALDRHKGARIPMSDMVGLVRAICLMSKAACPKEIDLPATKDTDA
jgi:short-subunit dehydrogenase